MRCACLSLCLTVLSVLPGSATQAAEPAPLNFSRDVRPILAEHCLGCHGADKPQADFRLTSRDAALGKGESGHVGIEPGKPAESEVIRRITAADPAERMPPDEKKPLKPAEIDILKRWVAEGPTHHFALGIGHRAQALRRIGEALGLETVIINLEK